MDVLSRLLWRRLFVASFLVMLFALATVIAKQQGWLVIDVVVYEFIRSFTDQLLRDVALYLHELTKPVLGAMYVGLSAIFIPLLIGREKFSVVETLSIPVSVILALVLTAYTKSVIMIERPVTAVIELSDYAFPSGHAAGVVAFLVTVILVVRQQHNGHVVAIIATVATSLILASRLILEVHRFSEVLAGAMLGMAVGVISHTVFLGLQYLHDRRYGTTTV